MRAYFKINSTKKIIKINQHLKGKEVEPDNTMQILDS